MTINGLQAIAKAMKLILLPIPKVIKPNIKRKIIMRLFLFLNKYLNLCSLDEASFLLVASMKGTKIFNNHFFTTFIGFMIKSISNCIAYIKV